MQRTNSNCMSFRKIALIPARLASTRFPQKLLQRLGTKSVIATVYHAVKNTGLFDDVTVVTDSPEIFDEITSSGGDAVMSAGRHESGSDRIAEAVQNMEADVVVNVQGDTPFITAEPLAALLAPFNDESVQVASLMQTITDAEQLANSNVVKVVVDKRGNALYFSRSTIPYVRTPGQAVSIFKHVGVYAFRKAALLQFTKWPVSVLEDAEKLEQLRYLENGVPIRMVHVQFTSVEIDTPADLERARALV